LLFGSYDCVDRIVLNAYYQLGNNPGGFRTWWRHLMRMAGRFARRVRASAGAHGILVIDCGCGNASTRSARTTTPADSTQSTASAAAEISQGSRRRPPEIRLVPTFGQ